MHHLRRALIPAVTILLTATGCSDSEQKATSQAAASACAADGRALAAALETYFADKGEYPEGEQELVDAGLLIEPSPALDLARANGSLTIVATKGGRCDGVELTRADTEEPASAEQECAIDRKVLEVATETYVASFGMQPANEAVLVDAGYIRTELDGYDLVDGAIMPVAGVCD